MQLFVVRHQHDPNCCPAADRQQGAILRNHLSRPNVLRHGVSVLAEAVVGSEHTLYMIVKAEPSLPSEAI